MVEFSLLRPPAFALSSLSALLFFAAFAILLLANVLFLTDVWHYSVTRAGFAFFLGPLTAAIVAGLSGRLGDRYGSARVGALGGIVFALASVWFLTVLDDPPHYLSRYLPGLLLGGAGVGLILPAFTTLAASTLPDARLSTGIGVQTAFRQIGAALGLAAFVAIVGNASLASKSTYEGPWLFMAIAAASAGLVLTPLFRSQSNRTAAVAEAPEDDPVPGRTGRAGAPRGAEEP